jgi:hypothetical protein
MDPHPDAHVPTFASGDESEAAAKLKAVEGALLKGIQPSNGRFALHSKTQPVAKKDDRQALLRQQDKVAACQAQVSHFGAMMERNKGNVQLEKQIKASLDLARERLQAAKTEQARMGRAVSGREAQGTFWGKF